MGRGFVLVICFFFQAEDGIRDGHVTGVQTCALPISHNGIFEARTGAAGRRYNRKGYGQSAYGRRPAAVAGRNSSSTRFVASIPCDNEDRSEERRVGKECRDRRSQYH